MVQPLHLRLFLSSPGDVHEERAIAAQVIQTLQTKQPWLGQVTLETVAWDAVNAKTPLHANEGPQTSVNRYNTRPSQCDLTLVILWSRLGTPLSDVFKPDGSPYASGTEWELEDARSAGKPVFLYERTEKPTFALDATDEEFVEARRQRQSVNAMLASFRNPDRSLSGGVNAYAGPAEFGPLLTQHLEAWLNTQLRSVAVALKPFRVFLATAAEDMRNQRMRLEGELRGLPGLELLPQGPPSEIPPPLEKNLHATRVRDLIKLSDVCVHLVGTGSGQYIEDDPGTTYVREQLQIGLAEARKQLVLQSPLKTGTVNDPSWKTLLDELAGLRDPRLQIVQGNRDALRDELFRLQREQDEGPRKNRARNGRVPLRRVFVDGHPSDAGHTQLLLASLRARGIETRTTTDSSFPLPASQVAAFEQGLAEADLLLLVYGVVPRVHVDQRLDIAQRWVAAHRSACRLSVYVAPPGKSAEDARFAKALFHVLDHSTGFSETSLDATLAWAEAPA